MPALASEEKLSTPRYGLVALLTANVLLAFGPILVRFSDTGPIASAFWRMALALPILAMLAKVGTRGSPRITMGFSLVITLSGLMFAADLAAWHLGIVRTKAANATLFGNSASLIFPIYGFVVARMWPSRRQGTALAMALAGTILLLGRSAELSSDHLIGDLLCLLAGVFYATYFIVIARVRETMAPLPLLTASTLASAVPLLAVAWAMGERIMPSDWTPLILLSLGSQILGQGLMTYALGRMSPLIIGLTLMTQPAIAALAGWIAFNETLGPADIVGAVLVGLALILVRQPEPKSVN